MSRGIPTSVGVLFALLAACGNDASPFDPDVDGNPPPAASASVVVLVDTHWTHLFLQNPAD